MPCPSVRHRRPKTSTIFCRRSWNARGSPLRNRFREPRKVMTVLVSAPFRRNPSVFAGRCRHRFRRHDHQTLLSGRNRSRSTLYSTTSRYEPHQLYLAHELMRSTTASCFYFFGKHEITVREVNERGRPMASKNGNKSLNRNAIGCVIFHVPC